MQVRNFSRLFAAGVLGGSLLAGCATMDDDLSGAVAQSQAPLLLADADNAIEGQYIVVFKDGTDGASVSASMNRMSVMGAANRVERTYSVIPGFAARLDSEGLAEVRRNPQVAYVEQDTLVTLGATRATQADGIDRVDQRQGRDGIYNDHGSNGSGVDIYIVDTGIRSTHNEFTGRMGNGASAINDGRGAEDCNGHGTHVASTAAGDEFGIANGATLHAVRVLDCRGSGSNSGVIAGVDFVRTDCGNRTCVANMSLGGGASSALDNAVRNAVNSGVTFVVAAGNENQNACNVSPAREASAITVGATADNDSRASFSNFGSCVDIFAPGVSILGADIGNDNDTQSISGTSMASPHVAGVAAQFLSNNRNASPAQVEAAIEGVAATNCVSGANGSPNLFLHNDFGAADFDCNGGGGGGGGLCDGFCGGAAPEGCFCDDVCEFFGDCCPGKVDDCG